MPKESIYLNELGYKNVFADKDTIIWFWEQRIKQFNRQNAKTRYWLDLLEHHEKQLLKLQAFELLHYLKSKASKEQLDKRFAARAVAKAKAQLEWENLKEWQSNYRLKVELTTIKHLN